MTGGAGYIGSHTCVELAASGFEIAVVDSLINSRRSVIARVGKLIGKPVQFYCGDVRDRALLSTVFSDNEFHAVIHFAGLKAVGESVSEPLRYYNCNVVGTIDLLEAMEEHGVRRIVFSSSATVYGEASSPPFEEDAPTQPANPYGRTKLMIEEILSDHARAGVGWKAVLLRYFNPVGAHESGTMGEDPSGVPNNLMPYVSQVAAGKLKELSVFGNDYPTPDGTGIRDYIHVVDLARGHVAAIDAMDRLPAVAVLNLGTGRGYSVLEVIDAYRKASGQDIPFTFAARRPGDVAVSYAETSLAQSLLNWKTGRDLHAMCRDSWHWQTWRAEHEGEL